MDYSSKKVRNPAARKALMLQEAQCRASATEQATFARVLDRLAASAEAHPVAGSMKREAALYRYLSSVSTDRADTIEALLDAEREQVPA